MGVVSQQVSPEKWALARDAVAGRLVNAYSKNDWTLGVLYRYQRFTSTVALTFQ